MNLRLKRSDFHKDTGITYRKQNKFWMPRPSHIDSITEQSYLDSSYQIFKPSFTIKIGQTHPDLDEFLIDNNAFKWAFISAYNPFSKVESETVNYQNHQRLIEKIKTLDYYFVEGEGKAADERWTPEKSLFILGISEEESIQIARFFQQNAIVVGAVNQKARLVWCVD